MGSENIGIYFKIGIFYQVIIKLKLLKIPALPQFLFLQIRSMADYITQTHHSEKAVFLIDDEILLIPMVRTVFENLPDDVMTVKRTVVFIEKNQGSKLSYPYLPEVLSSEEYHCG